MKDEIVRMEVMIHHVGFLNPIAWWLFGAQGAFWLVIEEVVRGEAMEHPPVDLLEDFEERMHGVKHSLIGKGIGVAIVVVSKTLCFLHAVRSETLLCQQLLMAFSHEI
jgi:hypothetical protein